MAEPTPPGSQPGLFPNTHWSMVVEAGHSSAPGAVAARDRLYRAYQPALIRFLVRHGTSPDAAEEAVQGFFAALLRPKRLSQVKPTGRFRSWLLQSLKNHMRDVWAKGAAEKRGGGIAPEVLGTTQEGEPAVDPRSSGRTPDQEYDLHFALELLRLVLLRLEQEFRALGKQDRFEALQEFLIDKKGDESHAAIGKKLEMTELAVTAEITRMRKRFRELFDQQLLELVGSREELEAEKEHLFAALRS